MRQEPQAPFLRLQNGRFETASPTSSVPMPASPPQASVLQVPSSATLQGLTYHMVLEEDIQREVEVPSDDEDEEQMYGDMGQGIGREDSVPIENEVDPEVGLPDDEVDGNEKGKLPPLWLMTEFKARLAECSSRTSNNLPKLYALGTFWFPQKSSYFLLQDNDLIPETLFRPRFFLWDPEPLVFGGIPCPNCKTKLTRHGSQNWPRRCVDLQGTFWIIGFRYKCPSCHNPISGKGTVTFSSWDSRILHSLPATLACEFPARLSYRSAISHETFAFMRSCFQNGMGAKQFADALRVQYIRRYDALHLQYLEEIFNRQEGVGKKIFDPFLPFNDTSLRGFHGFVPSDKWLGKMYDRDMLLHEAEFNQHTAMLPADICAIDHSHKVR
jgi:hypothetical protein